MPLHRFHSGTRNPSDGDIGGNAILDGAVAHPCLPFVPEIVEELEFWKTPIAGDFLRPPDLILNVAMASEWTLNANFSDGFTTVSVVNEVLSLGAVTLGQRSGPQTGAGAAYSILQEEGSSFLTFEISVGVLIGAANLQWTPDLSGQWAPAIFSTINGIARNNENEIVHFVGVGFGTSNTETPETCGLSVSVCGETLEYYRTGGGDSVTLSGTITLEPTAWLAPE